MTRSYWLDTNKMPAFFPGLERSISTDVLVIGGGITGLTAAYLLSKKGRKVTVVDAGDLCGGETGRTSAHLTEALDWGYDELEQLHGKMNARTAFLSQRAAIRFIEKTVEEEAIDCDFERVNGYLFLSPEGDRKTLEQKAESFRSVGLTDAQVVETPDVTGFAPGASVRLPDQAQFHPVRYLAALAARIQENGGRFFTNTHIESIEPNKAYTAGGYQISARHILITTHSPIKNLLFFLKEAAYRTYVIAAEVPQGSVTHALYWDAGDPYHYVRVSKKDASTDLLIVGGEDHKTGQGAPNEKPFENLELWMRKNFPLAGQVAYRWSGQVIEPVDGLPYIGKSPYHHDIYIATGYSGNGMTSGTLAGILLSDILLGIKNDWKRLYNPTRKNLFSSVDLAKENLNVMCEMVGGYLKKSSHLPSSDLERGEGAVIQRGVQKIAAWRDEKGRLFECSAVCSHLKCIVQWNSSEKTFDCPCHGSRFSGEGKVLTGPAIQDLRKITTPVLREGDVPSKQDVV